MTIMVCVSSLPSCPTCSRAALHSFAFPHSPPVPPSVLPVVGSAACADCIHGLPSAQLIGNKSDLEHRRAVAYEEGEQFARVSLGCKPCLGTHQQQDGQHSAEYISHPS
jgi:hypothetical protein